MKTAIAAELFDRNRNASPQSQPWVWPNNGGLAEVQPDPRLLAAEIPGVSARIFFPDESVVTAEVRAIAAHDLVLRVQDLASVPIRGQLVTVMLCKDGEVLLDGEKAVLHWSGRINNRAIVALFTIKANEERLKDCYTADTRGELRFPVQLPAKIESGDGRLINARIVDYSLNGCRMMCEQELALDCEYHTTICAGASSIDVAIRPRWAMKVANQYQMGCTFRSDEGVLLATRHHQQPTTRERGSGAHQSEPPRGPVMHNWDDSRR